MSEKVWNATLEPTSSQRGNQENDTSGTQTPSSVQQSLPIFDPNEATNAAIFGGSVPSIPPPSAASAAPTTSTEAADPYHIATPKPDITVGIAHAEFSAQHQRRLVGHQAAGSILSDPHAAEMGVRFPFLVIEVKGLSMNGSLVSAQNQAAISGASMLAILQDLGDQVDWSTRSITNPWSASTLQDTPTLLLYRYHKPYT